MTCNEKTSFNGVKNILKVAPIPLIDGTRSGLQTAEEQRIAPPVLTLLLQRNLSILDTNFSDAKVCLEYKLNTTEYYRRTHWILPQIQDSEEGIDRDEN